MNDGLKMQISAFVDGELPENESELLLRRLSQDAALRQQVALYMAIGRLMRRDPEVPGTNELRDRIAAALGEEPVDVAAEIGRSGSKFTRPVLGAAIAATVAVLAVLALRPNLSPDDDEVAVDDFVGRTVPESQTVAEQADDELLRRLYLHHNPRLVTWQLRGGVLIESDSEETAVDSGDAVADSDSQDW